jgi:hypothetical protein
MRLRSHLSSLPLPRGVKSRAPFLRGRVTDPQGGGVRSKGTGVIPDLQGRVAHIDEREILDHLGHSQAPNWKNPLRTRSGDKLIRGQFICPQGACFDREGNIFVGKWADAGRVTKLRKVA